MHVWIPMEAKREHQIPWSYKSSLTIGLETELGHLLTTEPSFQAVFDYFGDWASVCSYNWP